MNTASLELCKELYELSGRTWHEEITYSWHKDDGEYVIEDFWTGSICPAYDLGYLLRKLPGARLQQLPGEPTVYRASFIYWTGERKHAEYIDFDMETPEDAIALLAIELFKKGIV